MRLRLRLAWKPMISFGWDPDSDQPVECVDCRLNFCERSGFA